MKGLYLVTDRDLCGDRSLTEVVIEAVKGGVNYVQLREKNAATRKFVEEALEIKKMLALYKIPLIINDRIDVALAVEADGVHIGQDDMPYLIARKLMGHNAIIGLSVENMDQVKEAEDFDVDYLGVSPIFETPTKTDTKGSFGLSGLSEVRAVSHHQLVAIGGINETNAADVKKAGADAIAVVSAICAASNPREASQKLRSLIDD